MKNATVIVGIVLIIAGTLALVYQGISYTQEEQVADIGILEVRQQNTETIPVPPIVGGAVLLAGILLVLYGARNRAQ